jgi:hypothetical protein
MSAIILRFPGFLLADDGKGFLKDGKFHPSVDALMESLTESERCQVQDWSRRRFPQALAKRREGAA